eukprot:TRINITY_DN30472_c0_g1_i1.p1 TRINITY_DN30472_c0_g1~~TRINITY_DN30472_c0_g1_i1.p1  ORF type:complete len:262 (+),score=97.96 TRINITY_DN30472_c0_g1_i1:70-786(+)
MGDHSGCNHHACNASGGEVVGPRMEYLSWTDYFMLLAELSAQRSKDPNRQVGACIVDDDRRVMGIGYNGFPTGCSDSELPWAGKERLRGGKGGTVVDHDTLETKYPYVCHAEANAILNCHTRNLKGCTIYVTLFPCNECAKLIIQSQIKRVVYASDKNHNSPVWIAARRLFDLAGVDYVQLEPHQESITLSLDTARPSHLRPRTLPPSQPPHRGACAAAFAAGLAAGAALMWLRPRHV